MLPTQNNNIATDKDALSPIEHLNGSIERVTFHSEESGFCVLKVKVRGQTDLMTVTGIAASVSPGEYIDCDGQFINDRQYGLQFKSSRLSIVPPGTLEGIEKYLGSGMIQGIGPHFAKTLVKTFGEDVLNIIEQNPEKLLSLPGIGHIRMQRVVSGWAEQKIIREIMVFLQSYGVGTSRAVRIYKTYGNNAIAKVSENPYQLAVDIYGIGFKTADTIAVKLGIPSDSLIRVQAGVKHALEELATQGHCACVSEELAKMTGSLLNIPEVLAEEAINQELNNGNLIAEDINGKRLIYLKTLHQAEVGIDASLQRLMNKENRWSYIDLDKALNILNQSGSIALSASQTKALELALNHKVLVITGGPGVGKTTLVKSILQVLSAEKARVALCAPTGRAAKRLFESTGLEAKTIHRLLEFDPKNGAFRRNQDHPISADIIVVDETSMIDLLLMNQLLEAVPAEASLLLIGDIDQLPSVGPGAVLSDIIGSGIVPTVRLTEIFRQASSSKIVVNAHKINAGEIPASEPNQEELSDFYFIAAETAEEITNKLLTVVCERIPKRFGFDPINDIQVLTPMNKGGLGSRTLNIELQKRLNNSTSADQINRFGSTYACGDKVIQLVNNYDKDVFNGDMGTIGSINTEDKLLTINFDEKEIEYDFHELDELALAYAVSIHKSQGSEYKAVVIPLSTAHYPMLERNLLYTGVTRGKKLVVIIGQKRALSMAVSNKRAGQRVTTLQHRLQQLAKTSIS